jgi:hypothetical protein
MSHFGPVCRCIVDMMSGYSTSRCRGQMAAGLCREGDKECGHRAACRILTHLLRRKMEAACSSEMLVCTSDPYTAVQPGGPQSEHTLPLKNL